MCFICYHYNILASHAMWFLYLACKWWSLDGGEHARVNWPLVYIIAVGSSSVEPNLCEICGKCRAFLRIVDTQVQ